MKRLNAKTKTALKHLLVHTGVYLALTGRRPGSKTTTADVWAWLVREFRAEHPSQYNILLLRQQERINWEKSNGRYSATDQDNLNKAFTQLYASTMHQQELLGEDELDAIIDALGLKGVKPLLKSSFSSYLAEKSVEGDALKEILVTLAELDQDEFDTTIKLFVEPGLLASTPQSFLRLLSMGYYKLGEVLRGLIIETVDVSKELSGYLSDDVKRVRNATGKHIPSKRTLVQKSRSARRALFGKYTT